MGAQYDSGDMHESEIKHTTIQVMRQHTELKQLVTYLKKTLPKNLIVDGKKALSANVPAAPHSIIEKVSGGLIKSPTEWPVQLSKSAIPQAGTENPKYTKYKVQHPTEHELKLWFVSLCATKGAQDTEGFQHFLKSDEHRIAEFGTDYHGVCGRCTIS
jgi:hypothetical protein